VVLRAPVSRTVRERLVAQTELARGLAQPTVAKPAMPGEGPFKYEARVLRGIWAAAPYLHNGSVPTLADLLEPAAARPAAFRIGPEYDPERVGLAAEQPRFDRVLQTTACAGRASGQGWDSGNGRCGHEYGLDLTPAQKRALLEYLKTL
jgi:cytochrome c peroxidase